MKNLNELEGELKSLKKKEKEIEKQIENLQNERRLELCKDYVGKYYLSLYYNTTFKVLDIKQGDKTLYIDVIVVHLKGDENSLSYIEKNQFPVEMIQQRSQPCSKETFERLYNSTLEQLKNVEL